MTKGGFLYSNKYSEPLPKKILENASVLPADGKSVYLLLPLLLLGINYLLKTTNQWS